MTSTTTESRSGADDARTPTASPGRAGTFRSLSTRLVGGRRLSDTTRLFWWIEVLTIAAFYGAYTMIRNANGNDPNAAREHAFQLIRLQDALGLSSERTLQQWAISVKPLIILCNYFYGSFHFVVTGCVLVYLYRRCSDAYPLWRNTLGITTALALIGFTLWPLMPPRLLPAHYGFVDTMAQYPTFWSFKSETVNTISNQFAAMPSVHCAWSLWCAIVLVPRLRKPWARGLAVAYPVMTLIAIVLTANHYFLDALGGYATLGIGYAIARLVTRAGRRVPEAATTRLEVATAPPS